MQNYVNAEMVVPGRAAGRRIGREELARCRQNFQERR